jgi:hypothetical protein
MASISAAEVSPGESAKKTVGKAMNVEELRLNKQLLKEISRKKKEKILGTAAASIAGHSSLPEDAYE